MNRKDLLGIEDLSKEEIEEILKVAKSMEEILERPIKIAPTLRGITVANLFFEPSTRTLNSFTLAEKRLSADSINLVSSSSSVLKGETLLDTAKNIQAMEVDIIVIRHSIPGAPHFLAERLDASVINAGDGAHEHPTQALSDLMTIRKKFSKIKDLKVAIVGDIEHSRVARSLIIGLNKMGAKVFVCGPPTLIPKWMDIFDVTIKYNLEEILPDKDILYILRVQKERQEESLLPSMREYIKYYSLTYERLRKFASSKVIIMHPGPINRGIEIESRVADSEYSLILDQVISGVAVRMSILYLLSRKKIDENSN
ncbi:MAG: aspartate carbamoyltransferase catalytic subunit [Candidatus Stahlbacteria bacterium]|jgi:aspartate carbamoyltransferase catalytic subunit|nr:MAG: aspartate carbamoyltransferase catalytic subunit [Candidatus Stahlbacteria bacterium]